MNTPRVKIIGAGSIGNHLAQASRRMGWDVVVVDKSRDALHRMRDSIYPTRYGAWDTGISLYTAEEQPRGDFDVIFIGTPPDSHLDLARRALEEEPRVLQIEKPLCAPNDAFMGFSVACGKRHPNTAVVVGYDNVLCRSVQTAVDILRSGNIGTILTIDVEFREHWAGIFNAHPWLAGPHDSYLGFWERGGGASGEHSHALHMWRYLAQMAGIGKWDGMNAVMDMVEGDDGTDYDRIASFSFVTRDGKTGRVIQDVITSPTRKWFRVQGDNGFVEWIGNSDPKGDVLITQIGSGNPSTITVYEKARPDDFYVEIEHIAGIMTGEVDPADSPISLASGIDVMRVLKLAHDNRNEDMVGI